MCAAHDRHHDRRRNRRPVRTGVRHAPAAPERETGLQRRALCGGPRSAGRQRRGKLRNCAGGLCHTGTPTRSPPRSPTPAPRPRPEARVPRPVPVPALSGARRRVLRVEDGRQEEATVLLPQGGRRVCSFTRACGTGGTDPTEVDTVAVLTVPANDLVKPLHDRMPAIVEEGQFGLWLDPKETRPAKLLPLLAPYPVERHGDVGRQRPRQPRLRRRRGSARARRGTAETHLDATHTLRRRVSGQPARHSHQRHGSSNR